MIISSNGIFFSENVLHEFSFSNTEFSNYQEPKIGTELKGVVPNVLYSAFVEN